MFAEAAGTTSLVLGFFGADDAPGFTHRGLQKPGAPNEGKPGARAWPPSEVYLSLSRSSRSRDLCVPSWSVGRLTFGWRCDWGTVVLLMRAEAGKLDHVWFAEDTTGAIMSGLFNFSRERSVRLVPGCAVLQLKPGAVAGFALSSGGRAEVNIQTSHPRIHLNLLHKFL